MTTPRLLLITDPRYDDETLATKVEEVGASSGPGRCIVQLRDKRRSRATLRPLAERLRRITEKTGTWFAINGDVDLALDVGADGVHIPNWDEVAVKTARARGMRWISVPVHHRREVAKACDAAVEAILVSPVFETPGKGDARGLDSIREARRVIDEHATSGHDTPSQRPLIYALGGVFAKNAQRCIDAGAYGVACIRAVFDADDAAAAAAELLDSLPSREIRLVEHEESGY